jgi:phage N-6-adenine-methyltransferase
MTDFGGSTTPQDEKDCWQTPLWVFDALDMEFGFWLDAASSERNALCANFQPSGMIL